MSLARVYTHLDACLQGPFPKGKLGLPLLQQ